MLGSGRLAWALLLGVNACGNAGNGNVGTILDDPETQTHDGGTTRDSLPRDATNTPRVTGTGGATTAAMEPESPSSPAVPSSSQPPSGDGPGVGRDPGAAGSGDAGAGVTEDAAIDEPPSATDAGMPIDASAPPASTDTDAGAPEPAADVPPFVLPETEQCTGVEFVDAEKACLDLGGLSLSNPVLVTDADGEWNPGDVATLQIDLTTAPRDEPEFYEAPAIVAMFDVDSSAFASVEWRNWELFGMRPDETYTHDIALSLSENAPRGASVWLYLEPATSDGNTTTCDCPDVEVEGLVLQFQVQ